MDFLNNLRGTVENLFRIGLNGPQLNRRDVAELAARNADDTDYSRLKVAEPIDPEDAVTRRYALSSLTTAPILPAPRVRQASPQVVSSGVMRDGTPIDCYGTLVISITDLPEALRLTRAYRCQIELGRYVGLRRRGGARPNMPGGLYHPSPWIGGVTPAGSGGTRGGRQNLPAAVDRPSEWAVIGLPFGGSINPTAATVFAPWAQPLKLFDLNGNAVDTLDFAFRKRRKNRRPPGSYPNTLTGVFAFRYAFFDETSGRWVSGPWSERIYVRPKIYPLARYPTGGFPALDTIVADRPGLRELSFSIGSRVR